MEESLIIFPTSSPMQVSSPVLIQPSIISAILPSFAPLEPPIQLLMLADILVEGLTAPFRHTLVDIALHRRGHDIGEAMNPRPGDASSASGVSMASAQPSSN